MSRPDLGERLAQRLTLREQTRDLRPRDAAYLVVFLWLAAVIVWGTIEHFVDRETFPTIWLGMWWALQTVTTVGYGDVVPHQAAGRAVATLLLLGGLAFISVITATITSGFVALRERHARESGDDPVIQRLDAIAARLDALERELAARDGAKPPDA